MSDIAIATAERLIACAEQAFEADDAETAGALLRRAYLAAPTCPAILEAMANLATLTGRQDDAISALAGLEALSTFPLGTALLTAGRWREDRP